MNGGGKDPMTDAFEAPAPEARRVPAPGTRGTPVLAVRGGSVLAARGGFGLLLVVWLAALLGALGLHWSVRTRQHFAALGTQVDRIESAAAAEAGLAVVRATLDHRLALQAGLEPRAIDPWRTTRPLDFSGNLSEESDLRWRATVDDLGRRLNLNLVEPVQLRRFLTWFAIDSRRAARIADATLDWRDADDWTRVEGAEREDYLSVGAPHLPPNRAFGNVREWSRVMGVTDELYDRVSPYLSVEGSGRINVMTAPDPVLASLRGFGPEVLTVLRRGVVVSSLSELSGTLSAAGRAALLPHRAWLESQITFLTEEMRIEVVGYRPGGGYEARMRAVLARSGRTSSLIEVREVR